MKVESLTPEEVLSAPLTAGELLAWMKAHPEEDHKSVAERFNRLAQKEFVERIKKSAGVFDPDMHYDLQAKKAEELE